MPPPPPPHAAPTAGAATGAKPPAGVSGASAPPAQVRNEIFSAFEQIYPVLQEFRKLPAAAAATALTPAT